MHSSYSSPYAEGQEKLLFVIYNIHLVIIYIVVILHILVILYIVVILIVHKL